MDFSHEAGEGPTPTGGIGVAAAEESRSLHRAEQQAMAEPAQSGTASHGGAGTAEPARRSQRRAAACCFFIDFAHEAGEVPTPKATVTAGGIGAGLQRSRAVSRALCPEPFRRNLKAGSRHAKNKK